MEEDEMDNDGEMDLVNMLLNYFNRPRLGGQRELYDSIISHGWARLPIMFVSLELPQPSPYLSAARHVTYRIKHCVNRDGQMVFTAMSRL